MRIPTTVWMSHSEACLKSVQRRTWGPGSVATLPAKRGRDFANSPGASLRLTLSLTNGPSQKKYIYPTVCLTTRYYSLIQRQAIARSRRRLRIRLSAHNFVGLLQTHRCNPQETINDTSGDLTVSGLLQP